MTLVDDVPGGISTTNPRSVGVVALVAHARSVPSPRREAFASELTALGDGPGHVVVHTCHRVEVYVARRSFHGELPALPPGGVVLGDAAAVRHLISVACGLDSAVFGETQILHQLRETIADRQRQRRLDPALDRLFQAALHAGRIAHGWFSGPPRSLADVALDRIVAATERRPGRRILVVGAGRMGRLAAFAAARRGFSVIVTNRDLRRAEPLAREVGGATIPFGIDGAVVDLDGVVVAINGAWPVGPRDTDRLIGLAVPIVDLSSPPAVPETLRLRLGESLVSVDDLADHDGGPGERVRRRLEELISETGREYRRWLRARDAGSAIQAVVTNAEQRRLSEIQWLRRRLPGLSAEELGVVDQMSHRLVAGILHSPLAALNGDASGALERAARELFDV